MNQILCLCSLVIIVVVGNVSSHPHLSLDSLDQLFTKNMEMQEPHIHTVRDRTNQDTSMQVMKDLPNMDTKMEALHPMNNINHFDNMGMQNQEPVMDSGMRMSPMETIVKISGNPEEESPIFIPNFEFDDMSLMHKRDHRNEVSQEIDNIKDDSAMRDDFKMNTEGEMLPGMSQVTNLIPINALVEAFPNQYGLVKDIYDGFIKPSFTGEDNMMPKLTTNMDQTRQDELSQFMPSSEMRTREFQMHHPDGMTEKKITSRQFRPTYERETDQLLNTIYKR